MGIFGNDRGRPLFGMLGRRAPGAAQIEEFVGISELARTERRCTHCAGRSNCGPRAPFCPNGLLALRVKVLAGGGS